MAYIHTRDGNALYVKIWGEGRPVVLVHGWPLSADTWDYTAMKLAEAGYRVVAYDRRGFGRSDQPFGGYDYGTLSDDLSDVMTAAKCDDATLVGFSMGGGEVARYMARHAGRHVRQCALIASIVPYMLKTEENPHGVESSVFDQIRTSLLEDRAAFFAGFFRDFYGVGLLNQGVSDEVLEWTRAIAMSASLPATVACMESFARTDFRADLDAITVPTLVVHGTDDATVPIDATGRVVAKRLKHAQFKEYPGAPHGLFATHQEQLTQDLLAFVAS